VSGGLSPKHHSLSRVEGSKVTPALHPLGEGVRLFRLKKGNAEGLKRVVSSGVDRESVRGEVLFSADMGVANKMVFDQ